MSHRSDTVQRELQEGHQDGSLKNLYMNSRGRSRGRAHGRSGGELREHRSVLSETENLKEEGWSGVSQTTKFRGNDIFKEAVKFVLWEISKENLERALNGVMRD